MPNWTEETKGEISYTEEAKEGSAEKTWADLGDDTWADLGDTRWIDWAYIFYIIFTEESKGTISHDEETKGTISPTEETKGTIDWTEE